MSKLSEVTIHAITEGKLTEMLNEAISSAQNKEYTSIRMEVISGYGSFAIYSAPEGDYMADPSIKGDEEWIQYFEDQDLFDESELQVFRTKGISFKLVLTQEFDGLEEVIDEYDIDDIEEYKPSIMNIGKGYMDKVWSCSLEL